MKEREREIRTFTRRVSERKNQGRSEKLSDDVEGEIAS
jgi:hypothetical protein